MPIPTGSPKAPRSLAREQAYERLKQWIVDGTLRPGEVLRDQAIAVVLGVSRTPVREALRRLEDEGFVQTALNRWTRVAPLDLTRTIETYSIIEVLEVFALQGARLTVHDIKEMDRCNGHMRNALRRGQAAMALSCDEVFHAVWLAQTQNRELEKLIGQLKGRVRRVELAYWDRAAGREQSLREHAAILRALRQGSRRAAIAALKQNWEGAKRRLRTVSSGQQRDK